MTDTASLRRTQRQQRRQLTAQARIRAAEAVADHFLANPLWLRCRTIAAYIAVNGELSLDAIVDRMSTRRLQWFLPTLQRNKLGIMHMRRWNAPLVPERRNRYGIPEPTHCHRTAAELFISAVLVPLVAFDDRGNRIGMGAGYYDRWIYRIQQRSGRRPILIGCGYDFQRVSSLNPQPHDQAMDYLLTPSGLRRCV